MTQAIGERFQKETKYYREKLSGIALDWGKKPETYKQYLQAPKIPLIPPEQQGGAPLWEILNKRQSIRSFRDEFLKKEHLSQLLWATQGITRVQMGYELRTAPSAGALYPIETYLAVHNVEALAPGIYHYAIRTHELEQLHEGDFRLSTTRAALDQDMAYAANVVFIWTALFARSKWKYQQRAYRYVYLDAGHIAENLALAAVALGLGSCQIAALYDDEVNDLLGIDGEQESVLYMSVIGHPR
jgi:SagB-type dehydrogenase family enzyme